MYSIIRHIALIYMLSVFCAVDGEKNINDSAEDRIIGGDKAPKEFGLFHASLQNLTNHHVCGGAIISVNYVVTAAHCLLGAEPQYIQVVVGTTNLTKGGLSHNVASITIHENYNWTSRENDIGLVKVKLPFLKSFVTIINLENRHIIEGQIVFISGFGAVQPSAQSTPDMQLLTIPVFSQDTCKYAMRYTREVTDDMFCTFTKVGQGTCYGDSGSPIIRNDRLVGIVSWGIPCAVGFPDVHTRISPYVEWLQQHINRCVC